VNADQARLDDALALSWHAADLAGRAAELAGPEHGDHDTALAVADAVTRTAARVQALATTLVDRHLAARRTRRPGDTP
jgi:hypothetical protein